MIIAGGGTGGHLFPGIAIAEEFLRRDPAHRVLFIGTERGLEKKILGELGFPLRTLKVEGLKGRGPGRISASLLKIPGSLLASFRILRAFQPVIVVGVGGYASGPAVLAARLMGLKTAIAEQNAFPGLTNRILGRFADRIFVTFPASQRWFPAGRTRVTGNPIRAAFLADQTKTGKRDPRFTLLIFGGSQGAHAINRIVMEALGSLEHLKDQIRFIHQTGEKDREMVAAGLPGTGLCGGGLPVHHGHGGGLPGGRSAAVPGRRDLHRGDHRRREGGHPDPLSLRRERPSDAKRRGPRPGGRGGDDPGEGARRTEAGGGDRTALPASGGDQKMETASASLGNVRAAAAIVDGCLELVENRRPAACHWRRMMKETLKTGSMDRKIRRIHFVGIGGIGMSGIAEVLLNLGYEVSGSDLGSSDITQRLDDLGAAIHRGHAPPTSATPTSSSPPRPSGRTTRRSVAAHERNIPVIPRAEMLAELLKMKFSIAVSGSHGKTTTTSMVATLLAHGGLDPTMVIGGKLASIGSNARLGDGEVIVAEADESDGSFLKLSPCLAVITNIDREHLDHYRDLEEIQEAFLQFANIVPFYGATILCLDDPNVREILPRLKRTVITYGLSPEADYRAEGISFSGASSRFSLYCRNVLLGTAKLNVPGLFNVYNALAAVAVAREMDLTFPVIREGLQRFPGVQRRLEVRGEARGVTVVDDYGHHPTEIRATLAAARQVWPGRIIVIFQPHRYTRTKALFDEFLTAFGDADLLIVTDIYAASEEPIPGVTAEVALRGDPARGPSGRRPFFRVSTPLWNISFEIAQPTDVILTQGAGSVWKVGEAFLKRIGEGKDG